MVCILSFKSEFNKYIFLKVFHLRIYFLKLKDEAENDIMSYEDNKSKEKSRENEQV